MDGMRRSATPAQQQARFDQPSANPSQAQSPGQVNSATKASLPSVAHQEQSAPPKKTSKKRTVAIILGVLFSIVVFLGIASFVWYRHELSPVSSIESAKRPITIKPNTLPRQIAAQLKKAGLIRSETAFYFYVTQSNQRDKLQAGSYLLSPHDSTQQIVAELISGKVTQTSVTFYPGAVLDKGPKGSADTSVTSALKKAGYSDEQIDRALAAQYDQPLLFTGKPAGTTLEGYVFGDTYNITAGADAEAAIDRSLDEFSAIVTKHDLVNAYKAQGLTLYQGITLASMIQRELSTNSKQATTDQKIVAQIFLTRLKQHMPLGSDVTYQYAAAQLGVSPTPDLDSPYNTRKNQNLPPGPIAVPGEGALLAVAQPASTDYLYFLSGDDDKTYFAMTDQQHQSNIDAHCHKKCSEL